MNVEHQTNFLHCPKVKENSKINCDAQTFFLYKKQSVTKKREDILLQSFEPKITCGIVSSISKKDIYIESCRLLAQYSVLE